MPPWNQGGIIMQMTKARISRIRLGARTALVITAVAVVSAGGIATAQTRLQSSTAGFQNAASWETKFLGRWNEEDKAEYRGMSTSADSWQFYNLGYAVDANVSMFQATGKTQYLDRALLYVNNVIKTAKTSKSIPTSQYKDSYLGWGSNSHPDGDDNGREFPLYESYMWRYATNMLVAMKQNATVYQDAKYKAQYDSIVAFSEKNMFEKWMSRGSDNIYRSHTHMSSHWAMIAFDLSLVSSNATNVKKYETVYKKFDTDMRKQLKKTSVGGYTWSAPWGSTSSVQDVSHGNAIMAYVVHAYDAGNKAWTKADIDAFVITLDKTIWPSATKYAASVDGSGSDNGWFNDGFVDLGRYNSKLQERLEGHRVGQNIQFYASMALNAQRLSKGTSPAPTTPSTAPTTSSVKPPTTAAVPRLIDAVAAQKLAFVPTKQP
jgi:hypothetical protein